VEGVQDPIAFLSTEWGDWDVAVAAVKRAREIRMEQRREELKAVIPAIGRAVAAGVASLFR
jgi:hypothetical protein